MTMDHEHHDVALHRLAAEQRTHEHVRGLCEQLREHHHRAALPAELRTVTLTVTAPIVRDPAAGVSRSIGILNPTAVAVYLGIGGSTPAPGQRAISVPPKSLLVLPLDVADLDLGAAPADLAAGDATVFVLRYAHVQPAHLGVAP